MKLTGTELERYTATATIVSTHNMQPESPRPWILVIARKADGNILTGEWKGTKLPILASKAHAVPNCIRRVAGSLVVTYDFS